MPRSTDQLRICLLIDAWYPFVGGGQVHVSQLIKNLTNNFNCRFRLFHSPHHHIIIRFLWIFWLLPQVILAHKRRPFDLIHAHAYWAGLPGKLLSLLLRLPVVYTVHGTHLTDLKQRGAKAWGEKFLNTKIRYTHQISVTESFTKYPNVNKNISIIRNGVDIKEFSSIKMQKYKNFTLLFIGRNHPTKGLAVLKQAFALAQDQVPGVRLKLITSGLSGRRLIAAYKQAHAFVLPSLAEGSPLVLLEAWAAKLPVIASQTAGVGEIASARTAVLVQPNNTAQLTQAIIKVVRMNPAARARLAAAGYRLAKKFFTWDKIAGETYAVYQTVINR